MKSLDDLQAGSALIVAENKFNGADGLINLSCLELADKPAEGTMYLIDVLDGLALAPSLDFFKGYASVKINFTEVEHKHYVAYRSKCSGISKIAKSLGAEAGKSILLYSSDISVKGKNGEPKKLAGALYLGTEREQEQEQA